MRCCARWASGCGTSFTADVLECALAGADVATVPYKVFEQLIKHPLTDVGLANFLKDWEKTKQATGAKR